MAGVGFELKKVFRGGSVLAAVEGYSAAAVVTEGPMLLLMLVLLALYRLIGLSAHPIWCGNSFCFS